MKENTVQGLTLWLLCSTDTCNASITVVSLLLWCYECRGTGCFFLCMFQFFWICSKAWDILGCTVDWISVVWELFTLTSTVSTRSYSLTSSGVTFAQHPGQQVLLQNFCMQSILTGMKRHINVAFSCIFLVARESEHFLMSVRHLNLFF